MIEWNKYPEHDIDVMALRTLTISSYPPLHHLFVFAAAGGNANSILTRSSFPALLGGSRLFQLYHRPSFSSRSNTQGIRSQTMAGISSTVPSIVVYVTVPNKEEGKKLAQSIIKEKLAGCVNQVPGIESTYWWNDKIETDSEELLIIKTRQSLLEALTAHVKANHPYEVPEVISLPITGGNYDYLKWLKENTRE